MAEWVYKSERIKLAREVNGLKQAELARILGIDRQNLARLEREGVYPGVKMLEKIANALDCPPKFFFVRSGGKSPGEAEEKGAA